MPTIALTDIPAGEMKRAPLNVWRADIQAAVNALDGTNFGAGALAATHVLRARVSGDSDQRLAIQADGTLVWGSGAAVGDTKLYRSGADTLKTDDALHIGANIQLHPDGHLQLTERTNPAAVANVAVIYAKDNGAGKTQLMVQMPTGTPIQLAIEA